MTPGDKALMKIGQPSQNRGKLVGHARRWVLQMKADLEKWRLIKAARLGCAALSG